MKLDLDTANRGCTVSTADHRTACIIPFNPDGGADAESTNRQVERAAVLSAKHSQHSAQTSYHSQNNRSSCDIGLHDLQVLDSPVAVQVDVGVANGQTHSGAGYQPYGRLGQAEI